MKRRDARAFWLFVGPFLIGLAIFAYLPIGWSAYLSFFDARNTVTPTRFVGLDNYAHMLTDEPFLSSLGTFSVFALFIVPLTFVLSLALALGVHQLRFARSFFRSVFFLPFAYRALRAVFLPEAGERISQFGELPELALYLGTLITGVAILRRLRRKAPAAAS